MRPAHETAYVEFVAARRTHLRRVAYALCGDWHLADDLVQTALVKLYVAWPRIRRSGREEAYARQIIVRANIDHSRRPSRRERATDSFREMAAPSELRVEEKSELFDALQDLPVMQRKVVVLRHWLGMSVIETAEELGISDGAVKSYTSRALRALESTLSAAPRSGDVPVGPS